MHGEEVGDRLLGVVAGYLLWNGNLDNGPQTVTVIEHLAHRELTAHGPRNRERRARRCHPPRRDSRVVLEIRGVRVMGTHGVLDEGTRARRSPSSSTSTCTSTWRVAGVSDALDDTVDYAA